MARFGLAGLTESGDEEHADHDRVGDVPRGCEGDGLVPPVLLHGDDRREEEEREGEHLRNHVVERG